MKLHVTYCGAHISCGVASDEAVLGHHAPDDETAEHIVFPAPPDWRGDEPDTWYETRAQEWMRARKSVVA